MPDAPAVAEARKDDRQRTPDVSTAGRDGASAAPHEAAGQVDAGLAQAGALAAGAPAMLSPSMVMTLHRAAGNRAVTDLLTQQRRPAPAAEPAAPDKGKPFAEIAGLETEEASADEVTGEEAVPLTESEPVAASAPPPASPTPADPPPQPLEQTGSTEAGALLVDAIGAGHDQGQAVLQGSVESGIAAINAAIAQGESEVDAAAGRQLNAVRTSIQSARSKVRSLVSGEQAHLRQLKVSETARLAAWQRRAELTATERYDLQDHRIVAMALSYSQRAVQAGAGAANNAQNQIGGLASRARQIGEAKAAAASGKTAEIKQAQAKGAREIAQNDAAKIGEGLSGLMGALRNAGAQTGQAFQQQGEQVVAQLRGGLTPVLGQLGDVQQQASNTMGQAVTSGIQALATAERQFGQSLTSLERRLVKQIEAQVAAKKQELRQGGEQAIAAVKSQAANAQQTALTALNQLAATAGQTRMAPGAAQSTADMVARQLASAFGEVAADAGAASGQLVAGISNAAGQAVAAVNQAGAQAQAEVAHLADQATPRLAREGRHLAEQVSQAVSGGIKQGDELVAEAGRQLDQQLQQLESSFVSAFDQLQGQLNQEVANAVTKAQVPLGDLGTRIDSALQKIETDMSKSWLERQWDDLKEMASSPSFWAALGAALLVAVILVATLGTGIVALAIIGALAGAAAGFAGTLTNNLLDKKRKWSDDLLKNTLVGAAVGLVAGLATAGLAAGGAALLTPMLGAATAKVVALIAGVQIVTFVMTVVSNVASGHRWDKALLANLALAAVTERLMSKYMPVEPAVDVEPAASEAALVTDKAPIVEPNVKTEPGSQAEVKPAGETEPGAGGPAPKGAVDVDEMVSEWPDETVAQAPGAEAKDPAVADRMYRNFIEQSPTREAGIYRNTVTKEYIVIQGSEGTVSVGNGEAPMGKGWAQAWKEILDVHSDVGEWELQAHSHPVDPTTQVTDPANHLPSGAEGDFGVMVGESRSAGGQPRSSTIDITTPRGPDHTRFGYDPTADRPYWVDYPDGQGGRVTKSFESIEAYHKWFQKTFGIDLGNIPPDMASKAPGENVPSAPRVSVQNSTRLNPAEKATAARLEQQLGPDLVDLSESPHEGADFVGTYKGRETTFDALGDGSKSKYFDLKAFCKSITHHLNKSNDYTVIDMTGYDANQIKDVNTFLNSPGVDQTKVIKIGF